MRRRHPARYWVRVAGTPVSVPVVLSRHAVDRYIERVEPGVPAATAIEHILRLLSESTLESGPAVWDRTPRPAALYITIGDVSFAVRVSARRHGEFVVVTCIARRQRSSRSKWRRRRGAKRSGALGSSYLRPSAGPA